MTSAERGDPVRRLAVGEVVRFSEPRTNEEESERFIVRELRDERVLVEYICDMNIKPTFVYLAVELARDQG